MGEEKVHWVDELADRVEEFLRKRGKKEYVFNGGLSVSGLQHIGRLRGEVLIPEVVRRILEKRGYRIRQLITVYTQDPWKGKKAQREQFADPEEARKYTGWPLIRVPDPKGCHKNWVEHYWSDFGPYLPEFTDGKIGIVTTTDLYKEGLRDLILREIIPKKEKIREVINKYRGRKPYPPGWIPIEPICERCGRIDSTVALSVEGDKVRYKCKNCGFEGVTDVSNAKLNWRLEWASIWKVLSVDFEPYGKDHATPGGSRDSCVDLAVNVLGFEPPIGEWYEWVSIRVGGKESDMSSSGFVGITPREWLEIAHPQILRFLYLQAHPHRKVVIDLSRIPQYYEQYYRAERIYFGAEPAEDSEAKYLARTYELSHPGEPPRRLPVQVPFMHASILAQILGPHNFETAVERLRRTGHVRGELDEYSAKWLRGLLEKSYNWTLRYGPENARFSILESVDRSVLEQLCFREIFCRLARELESLDSWDEESIKNAMIRATEGLSSRERREFYREFYSLFIGKPYGPRAAPLLSLLQREFVVSRLKEACLEAGGS
ncbi:MAG: lysine--tRNA ligase [Desulfurococcales archaeon]|nr:lysine--tRNA ligase [Desulfurococcales archaeon]